MAADPHDWIDSALAQGAWTPPPGFTGGVVRQAMAILPARLRPKDRIVATVVRFRESMRARIGGWSWTLTQYRQLIVRSG
jgi:hypothetical protein